jgi:hypothetical protein
LLPLQGCCEAGEHPPGKQRPDETSNLDHRDQKPAPGKTEPTSTGPLTFGFIICESPVYHTTFGNPEWEIEISSS